MTRDELEHAAEANEPRFHKCENCDAPLPEDLEGCRSDDEGHWFCLPCFEALTEPDLEADASGFALGQGGDLNG